MVIVAVYNETEEIVGPTIESLTKVAFDPKKLIIVIAYEERGGPAVGKMVANLEKKYSKYFIV